MAIIASSCYLVKKRIADGRDLRTAILTGT